MKTSQVTFACLIILGLAAAQIPSPLSNGNAFTISGNAPVGTLTSTSASTLTLGFSNGVSGTLTIDGTAASTTGTGTEYFGRFSATISIFTIVVGMCFRVTPTSSSTVVGLTFRSNVTTVVTVTANMVSLNATTAAVATTQAASCNAGGFRPEYETALLDFSGGMITPLTCPLTSSSYTNLMVAGSSCGSGSVTVSGSGMSFSNISSCGALTTFFVTGTDLHCLHSFSRGENFLHLINDTAVPAYYYCVSYAVTGTGLNMTIVKNYCGADQTPTYEGTATGSGNFLVITLYGTAADSGVERAASVVVMLLSLAAALVSTTQLYT